MKTLCVTLALLATTALAGASAGQPEGPPGAPPLPEPEEIKALLAAYEVPGLAMAVLSDCQVQDVLTIGLANIEAETPVTALTGFEAASLSKPVFAYLVMMLVDEGVIALDRPIADEFGYARIPDKDNYAKITPRMILTHRTGLPNWVGQDVDFHGRTTPIPFEQVPGTAYSYSGEAIQLLQAYVEFKTGQSLQALFEERLGRLMPHSTFALPLPDTVAASRGYESAADPESGRDMIFIYDKGMAASSLVTVAEDYGNFVGHICSGNGLSEAAYNAMLMPQSEVPPDETDAPSSYGLGWQIQDLGPGQTLVFHGGNNDEYKALGGFIRETREGIVILTNGYNGIDVITTMLEPPEAPPAE